MANIKQTIEARDALEVAVSDFLADDMLDTGREVLGYRYALSCYQVLGYGVYEANDPVIYGQHTLLGEMIEGIARRKLNEDPAVMQAYRALVEAGKS